MLFSSITYCISMFASNIFILSVIFRDSEFYFFFEFLSIFKIRKNSRILRLFHIHKIRILDLRGWAIFRSVCLRGGQMSVPAAALQQTCGGGFDWDAGHTKRRSHCVLGRTTTLIVLYFLSDKNRQTLCLQHCPPSWLRVF